MGLYMSMPDPHPSAHTGMMWLHLLLAGCNEPPPPPSPQDHAFDKIRMGVERKSVRRTLDGRKCDGQGEGGWVCG